VLLLRHASAGERLLSPDIDRFRPLDPAGRADARQLVWALADRKLTRVVTSPLIRCVETVRPLAETRRIVPEQRRELLPDTSLESVLDLLDELSHSTLVCTHREVFQTLFAGEVECEEAGAWVLGQLGSLWSPMEYLAPPTSAADPFSRTALSR